jgi:hypothetical protein
MSLEGKKRIAEKVGRSLKGAAFAAALAGAGAAGVESGTGRFLERLNQHALTPAAIQQL